MASSMIWDNCPVPVIFASGPESDLENSIALLARYGGKSCAGDRNDRLNRNLRPHERWKTAWKGRVHQALEDMRASHQNKTIYVVAMAGGHWCNWERAELRKRTLLLGPSETLKEVGDYEGLKLWMEHKFGTIVASSEESEIALEQRRQNSKGARQCLKGHSLEECNVCIAMRLPEYEIYSNARGCDECDRSRTHCSFKRFTCTQGCNFYLCGECFEKPYPKELAPFDKSPNTVVEVRCETLPSLAYKDRELSTFAGIYRTVPGWIVHGAEVLRSGDNYCFKSSNTGKWLLTSNTGHITFNIGAIRFNSFDCPNGETVEVFFREEDYSDGVWKRSGLSIKVFILNDRVFERTRKQAIVIERNKKWKEYLKGMQTDKDFFDTVAAALGDDDSLNSQTKSRIKNVFEMDDERIVEATLEVLERKQDNEVFVAKDVVERRITENWMFFLDENVRKYIITLILRFFQECGTTLSSQVRSCIKAQFEINDYQIDEAIIWAIFLQECDE